MDVVVTVPKAMWQDWVAEGDLPGNPWSGWESHFWIAQGHLPVMEEGERVYVVAHGRLRGYSPLIYQELSCRLRPTSACLIRRGDAVAVTISEDIRGFQGWRYRWWDRDQEQPFPNWKDVAGEREHE